MRPSTRLPRLCLAGVLTCLVLGACSSIPRIPASGNFVEQRVATTVDAEVARYYLENYSQGRHDNREMDGQIAALYRSHDHSLPSREELKAISVGFSVDFAALFFADRLLNDACNRALNRRFARYLEDDAGVDADVASAYQILFVPGWDYISNGGLTGADFARPRELASRAGFENHLVKVPPTGSVEAGARVLAAAIATYRRSGKKILLAGTSSAGPAIHLALGELLDERDASAVKVWLNLGGILGGTPLVDFFETQPQRLLLDFYAWVKGWDREAIPSMGTAPSRARFSRLHLHSDLVVINYIGVPLSGQLSQFSGPGYRLLRSDGPNDGLVLLSDVIAPDSLTVVALGSDHFFAEDPEIDRKTVALIKLVVAYANKDPGIACTDQRSTALRRARPRVPGISLLAD
jgi:hypothetical protein